MAGDPRFHAILEQLGSLHDRKQEDYGAEGDPFANIRASEKWGIPSWVGALVRLNDKVHRLQQFAIKGSLANESAEDSMLDIAVYAVIALLLYREESQAAMEAEQAKPELPSVEEMKARVAGAKERLARESGPDFPPVVPCGDPDCACANAPGFEEA